MSQLAKEIWEEHIDVFEHFDLVCHNGSSLEDETKSNALFNALVTLKRMKKSSNNVLRKLEYTEAIDYLKGSRYYSADNIDNGY